MRSLLLIFLFLSFPALAFENLGNNALYLFPKEEGVLHIRGEASPGPSDPRIASVTSRVMTPVPVTDSFLIIPMMGYRLYSLDSARNYEYTPSSMMASLGYIQCVGDSFAYYAAYRRVYGSSEIRLSSNDYHDSADFLMVYSPDGIYSFQAGLTKDLSGLTPLPIPLLGFTRYPGDYSFDIEIFLPQKAFVYYYLTPKYSLLLKCEFHLDSWNYYQENKNSFELSYMSFRTITGFRYSPRKGIYLISEIGTAPFLRIKKENEASDSRGNIFVNLIFNISTEFFR